MKTQVTCFLIACIFSITALIIWSDYKTSLSPHVPIVVGDVGDTYESSQREALAKIHKRLQQEQANCFVDWDKKEAWVRSDLSGHSLIKCTVDVATRTKTVIVKYLDKIVHMVKQ